MIMWGPYWIWIESIQYDMGELMHGMLGKQIDRRERVIGGVDEYSYTDK